MIKAITCIKRKASFSVEDFQAYWCGPHAEVVKQLPHLRRYVQSHVLPGGYRKRELIYDGVAEIWVDNVDILRQFVKTDAYRAVQADEPNFLDPTANVLILTQDYTIKDGPTFENGVKNIEFIRRKPGLTIEEFQRYWYDVHGPIAAEIPVMPRYIQSHTLLGGYRDGKQPAWDGCAFTWFESVDAMRESAKTKAYARNVEDIPKFIGEMEFLITKEHIIVE